MTNNNFSEACTSYLTCGLWMDLGDMNWGTIGAAVLLAARLIKDVPDAYIAIRKHLEDKKKKKKKRKPHGKSKR